YQESSSLGTGRHLGQRVLSGLLVDQPATEQLPLLRPGDAGVDRRLCHPDREGTDAGTEQVEGAHRDPEALVALAEHVVSPDPDAVEVQRPDGMGRDHVELLAGQTGTVTGHSERGDPARS